MERTTETVTTEETSTVPATESSPKRDASGSQTVSYLVYFLFGIVEILLAFRFVLKLSGASATSGFVSFIYDLSGAFTWPFEGIFRSLFGQGAETTAVFEPSTLVAIAVYAVIAWGIVSLVAILSGERQNQ